MQNHAINQFGKTRHSFNPTTGGQAKPSPQSDPFQPFTNPDVYRPQLPTIEPDYPAQPKWLPPVPSGPIVEVPFDFPMELPPQPDVKEWTQLPTPQEIPDWSKAPAHLPAPSGPEINIPKEFDYTTNPQDGTWLLS